MKLSEMKQWLASNQAMLTKSLGQNFLHDANQLGRIAGAAELTGRDKVLEIGPGMGPLTERLIAGAGEVLAIELDKRLYAFLKERFAQAANLTLVHADALEHLRTHRRDWTEWKLVANLPYSVASPIMVELAQAPGSPERMVVTVQREVADRLMAKAGTSEYGVLSLLIQARFQPAGTFRIPGSCFFPEPDVESACATLLRREKPLVSGPTERVYIRVVKLAFSQRRKVMLKLLKAGGWSKERLAEAFGKVGLAENIRGEAVPPETFAALAELLTE